MSKGDRNSPCPCGSRLKFKRCHGDVAKTETAKKVASLVMGRAIAIEQFKKKLIDRAELEEYMKKTEFIIAGFKESERVEPEATPEPEEEVSVDDKLKDNGLTRCACGSVTTGDTKCMKCKKLETTNG